MVTVPKTFLRTVLDEDKCEVPNRFATGLLRKREAR